MRFFIDGTEWQTENSPLSRSEILDSLRDELSWDGKVILEMLCDGEVLDENDLLMVPDDIDIDVVTTSEFGVGLAVLAELERDITLQGERIADGTVDSMELAECLDYARQAIAMVAETYPECEANPEEGLVILASLEEVANSGHLDASEAFFRWNELALELKGFINRQKNDLIAMENCDAGDYEQEICNCPFGEEEQRGRPL